MREPFRLTPYDIRQQQFTRSFRGFEPREVDEFKQQVAEEVERLVREAAHAQERLRLVEEQLTVYREREAAMNEALVAAQQLRGEVRAQAEREAALVLREAEAEAARVLERGRHDERLVRERADSAARQLASYLAGFRALLHRHLGELDGLASQQALPPELQIAAPTGSEGA